MTTWDIRTLRSGSSNWDDLQVHGGEGLPVWNKDVKASVLEDGSLHITSVSSMVVDFVIEKVR